MNPSSSSTPLQKAIEAVEGLPIEDQDMVLELLKRRRAEQRREEIAKNARESRSAIREKTAKFGTVDDLRKDLDDEI